MTHVYIVIVWIVGSLLCALLMGVSAVFEDDPEMVAFAPLWPIWLIAAVLLVPALYVFKYGDRLRRRKRGGK